MAKFSVRRIHFGDQRGEGDDEGDGLPRPALVRLQARRAAGIREAKETLVGAATNALALHPNAQRYNTFFDGPWSCGRDCGGTLKGYVNDPP